MPYPQQTATVHVEQLGDELCIYDWQRKQVHSLNPTAARVWQRCDGQSSAAQIAAALLADMPPAQAEELVWMTLDQLAKAHLLEGELAKPAAFKGLNRRQFLKKAGMAAALLPAVYSIVAPAAVAAQSPVPTATASAISATDTAIPATPTDTPFPTPTPFPTDTPTVGPTTMPTSLP
jgi:hypothetical protein